MLTLVQDNCWSLAASIHTKSTHVVFLISEQRTIECRRNGSYGSSRSGWYIKEEKDILDEKYDERFIDLIFNFFI